MIKQDWIQAAIFAITLLCATGALVAAGLSEGAAAATVAPMPGVAR